MRLPEEQEPDVKNNDDLRKPYQKPEIIHELILETQAGSTLGLFPDPLDDDLTK